MGTRVVNSDFWRDEKIECFTPEDKYFWLYLLTNPQANLLGIYKITRKRMSFETGYALETIDNLIDRFESQYGLIRYKDNEIAIKNYLRHGIVKGGQPIYNALMRFLKDVKNKDFIKWVYKSVRSREDTPQTVKDALDAYVTETVDEDVTDDANANVNEVSPPVTHTVTHAVTQETTHKYGEYGWVKLTDKQHEKLLTDLGEEELKRCITYVDEAAQSTSNKNKWKDWNLVIRRCHRDGWGLNKNNGNAHKDVRRENLEAWLKNSESDADVVESSGEFVEVKGFTI